MFLQDLVFLRTQRRLLLISKSDLRNQLINWYINHIEAKCIFKRYILRNKISSILHEQGFNIACSET